MTEIPQEIWIKIFSYLPYHEVLQRISPVCKYFKNLCHDVNVKKHIQLFDTTKYDFEYGKQFLSNVTNLTKLHVTNYLKDADLVIIALKSSKHLKELIMKVDYDYTLLTQNEYGGEDLDVDLSSSE